MRGSEAGERAAAYIADYYRSLGLEVREQPFEVETGTLLEHRLEVLDPPLGEIPSWPALMTPDTPPEGLEADMVFLEGTNPPYAGPHIEGKAVMLCVGPQADSGKIMRFKPRAFIAIDNGIGLAPKRHAFGKVSFKPHEPVTGFRITYEDGLRLIQAGARRVRLLLRSECRTATTRNVIAELKGTEHPDEIIVVGGHYDGNPEISAASDNAAGAAVAMELARVYAERQSNRTLRFVAWAAEEGGCIGSQYYVSALKKQDKEERSASTFIKGRGKTELDKHLLSVAIDVVGLTVGYDTCYCLAGDDLTGMVKVLGSELGMPHEIHTNPFSSDHEPFVAAGIPGLCFARAGGAQAYLHGVEDCIDNLDAIHMGAVGRFVDTLLQRTANAQEWPLKREVPEDMRKRFKEVMKRMGDEVEEDKPA